MHENAWEWSLDWELGPPISHPFTSNGAVSGSARKGLGGCFGNAAERALVVDRFIDWQGRTGTMGSRVCLIPSDKSAEPQLSCCGEGRSGGAV